MPVPLPDFSAITVTSAVAEELLTAAESLPLYENKEFYDLDLQASVYRRIRERCPDQFDWLVDRVNKCFVKRPYCALLSGLKFDDGNRLFVGINRAFGDLVARPYEKPRAQLVHYIQPATDLPASHGTVFESEKLHTDTADWDPPVKLISMVCVRPDVDGGGRSQVLDVDTLRDEVQKQLGTEALQLLATEPVPWQLAAYLGGGVAWRPVLTDSSICWRRYTIDLALDSLGRQLSAEMSACLDSLEAVIASTPGIHEFTMREGDLLFTDNHKTIHARTPIASGPNSDRLMIRSWIRVAETGMPN